LLAKTLKFVVLVKISLVYLFPDVSF